VTAATAPASASDELVERVAAAVLSDPAVVDLHAGPLNAIGTHLPGGRLVGVRIAPGEPVELGVVLRLERPIPQVVAGLRATVAGLCGGAPVDILVADVEDGRMAP
jgi:hypothetical protein